jgi:alkylation response protein AidB-like acyl-CoA dehydrogenase
MDLWVKSEAVRLTNMRAAAARKVGTPGPEGSVAKLTHAELNQEIYELCVDMLGLEGQMFISRYEKIRPQATGMGSPDLPKAFLRSRANSLEGGTSEVMRNILGERVLGLPGEPRNDKDVPWKDVPRS